MATQVHTPKQQTIVQLPPMPRPTTVRARPRRHVRNSTAFAMTTVQYNGSLI